MIWVSFFKPVGIFEGSFNKLAAWWTAGDYCHCEIVWHVEPQELMDCVKKNYATLQGSEKNENKIKTIEHYYNNKNLFMFLFHYCGVTNLE